MFHNLIMQLVICLFIKLIKWFTLKRVILWYVNCTSGSLILTVIPSPPQVEEVAEFLIVPQNHIVFATSPVPWVLAAPENWFKKQRGPVERPLQPPPLGLSLLRLQSWLHSLICSLVFHENKSQQVWLPQVVWCEVKHRHLGLIFDFLMGVQVHWARSKGGHREPWRPKTD